MTISDIAKLAGVSSAAVSRYLNGGPLSEQKRAVIQAVVEKTGYSPDTAAQTLRTGKVRQVGVIVPSISSQSVGQIISGIATELSASRYLMLLADTELDEQMELAMRFQVSSIPMLVVFKDGKAVAKSVGYRPKSEIAAMVEGAR